MFDSPQCPAYGVWARQNTSTGRASRSSTRPHSYRWAGMSAQPIIDEISVMKGLQLVFRSIETTSGDFILREPISLPSGATINGASSVEIAEIITRLNSTKSKTESSFQWEHEAEFSLVSLDQFDAFGRLFEEKTFGGQGDNPVTYKVGRPSRAFAAYLLCKFAQNPFLMKSPRTRLVLNRIRGSDRNGVGKFLGEGDTLFDAIAEGLHATTLQIIAANSRSDFESLANSFLFHAAYNTDAAARIGLASIFRPQTVQRVRRSELSTLDAPRQTYDADLVHHYLMGIAAEIPLLEYLAYYHIAEHFFKKVFDEDLINRLRVSIVDPAFSVRRDKDIQSIIQTVVKAKIQIKDEGGTNEQRSLQLVLNRFVNVPRLIADLDAYDPSLTSYYANNGVPFAGASKVDIQVNDEEKVRIAIAARIYKVRNSLVHAKEGALPKYSPFAHDDELAREIPLMRFAAEQIVIAQGKAL
jgi:hypothetical protein